MKKYLITFIFLAVFIIEVSGQLTVSPPPSGGVPSFTATQPYGFPHSITPVLSPTGEKAPMSCLFMEYGDGRFTTRFTTDYNPTSSSGALNALMTFRGKYDGGHPTARIISKPYNVASNANINPQNDLPLRKNIMMRSDVIDLLEMDTIQVVLTFKKTFRGAGRVLFYYNDALLGFSSVSSENNPNYPNLKDANNVDFKQVRTYSPYISHCANIYKRTDLSSSACIFDPSSPSGSASIPISGSIIRRINDVQEIGYSNVLMCNVSENLPYGTEQNIFITLLTTNNIKISTKAYTSIRAYILPDNAQAAGYEIGNDSPEFSELTFSTIPYNDADPSAARPHDPNYIISKIKCLPATKCTGTTAINRFVSKVETIDYKVHFQNDGDGNADSINVDVYFPISKFDIRDKSSVRNINANIGGKNIFGNNLRYTVTKILRLRDQTAVIRFTLVNPFDGQNKPIKNVDLIGGGSALAKMGNMDPVTMGEINFTVSTQLTVPCYAAYAKIYFNNESPIITKTYNIKYCGDKIIRCNQILPCEDIKPEVKKEAKQITNIRVQ